MTQHSSTVEPGGFTPRLDEAEQELDLLKLWRTVWRRKWLLFGVALCAAIAAAAVALSLTPVYRAGATLLIEDEPAKVLSIEQVYGLEGSGIDYLQTQIELLKSRALAERVVRQLDLVHHPEFDPAQQPEPLFSVSGLVKQYDLARYLPFLPQGETAADEDLTPEKIVDLATRNLMARTIVSPQGKSQLVKVEVDMADAEMATRVANALVDGHIAIAQEASMGMATSATSWMNTRLIELRDKLLESENRLQAYRESENLVDVKGVATISAGELSATSDRMINARRERAEAESQYRQVETMKKGGLERMASIPAVLGHPLSQQFRAAQAQAQARVEEVSKRYGPRHPSMIAAQTELAAATASLKAQVEQIIAGIERNYQLALANERSLQSSFDVNKSEIQDISRKEFKVRELEREVESNRTLYETFMNRLKETSATSDLQTSNARVVDHAVLPTEPVRPKKALIVLVAAMLALCATAGVILLLDVLNDTFVTVEQVERKLNLPVLGILPIMPRLKRGELARLFGSNWSTAFSESIRTIRTRLIIGRADQPKQVVVVVSSLPGEGKSVVSANIANSLGQLERVLLIEADLRRPTLAKSFRFPLGAPGLADIVAGKATLEQCIHTVEGVDMISAGSVPNNPLELLSSTAFSALIEQLRVRYARVIVDSPPIQSVSDAVVIAALADSVIYVVKSAATPIAQIELGLAQLRQNKVQVSGVVLNQVDIDKARRYGYRYSGYYDYDGYSAGPQQAKA